MTRKDYNLLAEVIKDTREEFNYLNLSSRELLNALTNKLINRLENDNPRFDSEKFYKASSI